MKLSDRIFIAGHNGMVGSSLLRNLNLLKYEKLIVANKKQLNLLDQKATLEYFEKERPQIVIIAAARVGGINANLTYPGDFIYQNVQIQNNLIHSSLVTGVEKVIFLGSSCIYPAECSQPMKESYLLTGPLEKSNEGYALAKILGLKMLEFYNEQYGLNSISFMPCNLYGPNDSFDLNNSHVLSALVKKIVDAKLSKSNSVSVWGSGNPRREFMHVDDLARAIIYFSEKLDNHRFINIGWGEDISIKELAVLISKIANYQGELIFDISKPDGMMKKCMDVSKMKNLGFEPKIDLETGIKQMIDIYLKNYRL
jgi:GDP-L-fucose synthase